MSFELNSVLEQLQIPLAAGIVVFLRVGAVLAVMPALGERVVPARVRLAAALMLTALVAPMVAEDLVPRFGAARVPAELFFTEAVIGLALGITLRFFVHALQTAGEMAAQSASLAQIFGGSQVVDAQPAFSHVMLVAGLALAALADLHVKVVELLVLSYQLFPAGAFPSADLFSSWGLDRAAEAFRLAFTLAAPFVAAALVYNLAIGVINRAMPQLMVAFVGAPAISGGGLILLFLVLPTLLTQWQSALDAFFANPVALVP